MTFAQRIVWGVFCFAVGYSVAHLLFDLSPNSAVQWETLLTGMMAVGAAAWTVDAMRRSDAAEDARHADLRRQHEEVMQNERARQFEFDSRHAERRAYVGGSRFGDWSVKATMFADYVREDPPTNEMDRLFWLAEGLIVEFKSNLATFRTLDPNGLGVTARLRFDALEQREPWLDRLLADRTSRSDSLSNAIDHGHISDRTFIVRAARRCAELAPLAQAFQTDLTVEVSELAARRLEFDKIMTSS